MEWNDLDSVTPDIFSFSLVLTRYDRLEVETLHNALFEQNTDTAMYRQF